MIGTANPSRKVLKWLGAILLVALLVLAAVVLAQNGSKWVEQVSKHDWSISAPGLICAGLMLLISLLLVPIGWVKICHSLGSGLDRKELFGIWFNSQLGRYIPGKIWLFAGRTGYLKARGMHFFSAASAPVLELLHTIAGAGLAGGLALLLSGSPGLPLTIQRALMASMVLLVLVPLIRPAQKLFYRIRYGLSGDHLKGLNPQRSLGLVLVYALLWMLRGFSLWLWIVSFGLSIEGPWLPVAAAPLSWLAGYAAFFVPGGIGVREAAIVALLNYPGGAGLLLVVVAGHRLLLGVGEIIFALLSFRYLAGATEKTEG